MTGRKVREDQGDAGKEILRQVLVLNCLFRYDVINIWKHKMHHGRGTASNTWVTCVETGRITWSRCGKQMWFHRLAFSRN